VVESEQILWRALIASSDMLPVESFSVEAVRAHRQEGLAVSSRRYFRATWHCMWVTPKTQLLLLRGAYPTKRVGQFWPRETSMGDFGLNMDFSGDSYR